MSKTSNPLSDFLLKYFGSEDFLNGIGTPIVLYSAQRVQENIDVLSCAMSENFAKPQLLYAAKACPFRAVLDIFRLNRIGIEVQSIEELRSVKKAQFLPHSIWCNGAGKTPAFIEFAMKHDCTVVADSVDEWKRLLCHKMRDGSGNIGLRVNPGPASPSRFALQSKLGLNPTEASVALGEAAKAGLRTVVHAHLMSRSLGSQQVAEDLAPFCSWLHQLPGNIKDSIDTINIGGGLDSRLLKDHDGTEVRASVESISALLGEFGRCKNIVIECGRYFVEDAAVAVGSVTGVKSVQQHNWLIIDVPTNLLVPIPSAEFLVDSPFLSSPRETYGVADLICSPAAIINREVEIPNLNVDDRIFVFKCGAYTYTLAESFGTHIPPAEMLTDSGHIALFTKETATNLWDAVYAGGEELKSTPKSN